MCDMLAVTAQIRIANVTHRHDTFFDPVVKPVTVARVTPSRTSEGRMDNRKCKMCGAPIQWWERIDKTFCDANCRKRWSRRKEVIPKERDVVMSSLAALRRCAKDHADLRPDVVEQLHALRAEITDILRQFDRAEMLEQADRAELVAAFQDRHLID